MKGNFDNASDSFKRRNPHLFGLGGVQAEVGQQKVDRALDGESPRHAARARGMAKSHRAYRVAIIAFTNREFDSDNLIFGLKPIRDAIAISLGMNDADRFIKWEYSQHHTSGDEGTLVRIQKL